MNLNLCNHDDIQISISIFISYKFKGGIDNKNESIRYRHSLNKERRRRELQRITEQNQQILKRIQDSQPTYNHLLWEEEAQVKEQIVANISEFKPKPSIKKRENYSECDTMLLEYDELYR